MKIAFIGDPHLDSQTPISRLDDYREVTIKKLISLLDLCLKEDVTEVIMPGDMFDKYDQPITYLSQVTEAFKMFRDNDVRVWSLIGNHDLPHNNMRFFKTTPLNLLFNSGLVHHLPNRLDGIHLYKPIKLYGIDFTNMDAVDDMVVDDATYNILVMHYATDNTVANDSIHRDRLAKFDLVVSGHDHMFYPISKEGKTTVLRPGSFTRRTKEEYNLTRDIIVYTLDINTQKIEELKLPGVKPAEDVFTNEAITGVSPNIYNSDLGKIFNDDYFSRESEGIFEDIDELSLPVTEKSKDSIRQFLIGKGVSE